MLLLQKMKKFALIFVLISLFSCAKRQPTADEKKISVVATIFPIYDWTREILGENPGKIELSLLIRDQVDMHSFQPSAQDLMTLASCNLAVFVGGESDKWLEDAFADSHSTRLELNLLSALGDFARLEETLEGMEAEENEEEREFDEHVWLSLKNAQVLTQKIAESLAEIDAANAQFYFENAQKYAQKLKNLDSDFQSAVENAKNRTLIVCDRFPFRYLADDYGLECFAAFSGCSAETEASFKTIAFLSEKLKEKRLHFVATCEKSDGKIARTVIQNSGVSAQIVELDSLQSTDLRDANSGKTYVDAMKSNLDSLKKILE